MISRIFLFVLMLSACVYALSDSELITLRDGFDTRRDTMLAAQVASPYPFAEVPGEDESVVGNYVWNRQDFALAALYLNVQVSEANQAIIDACNAIKAAPDEYNVNFHWRGNLFYRIYKYFCHGSEYFPGRLSSAAEEAIYDIFWNWAKSHSKMSEADFTESQTWYIWGSENHDAMYRSTSYSAADILKDVPAYQALTYEDGSNASQQYDAWTLYFKEYFSQRARKGLLMELGSHTYSKYTLQGWYNFYDFAPDEQLATLAGNVLDVWWADWAQDQINAVRGGGKIRIYQDASTLANQDSAYSMVWYYINKGTAAGRHPGVMCMATSTYRLPLVVMDIAMDTAGKGTYESRSRRPGLLSIERGEDNIQGIDAAAAGIYRYTYCKPEFVLGSCMWAKLLHEDWVAGSSQNRWIGAIFSTHANARIFPQCVGLNNGKTYNQYWSVQNKGTLITQKLSTSVQAGDMRVFFSGGATNMTMTEEDGWVFARMPNAFAAVRPAWGSYSWDDANWLRMSDEYAPVIIEVAASSEFSNVFSLFKVSVKANVPVVDGSGVLTYTGLLDSGTFTFYTQSADLPQINGTAIDLSPSYTFSSPYLNEQWDSGIVTISKDDRNLTLDFNYAQPVCGEVDYDFNDDCIIDVEDLKHLAAYWLECSEYSEPLFEVDITKEGCVNGLDFSAFSGHWLEMVP